MPLTTKQKEYFQGYRSNQFEGPESDNPLAYRWYDENRMVAGKSAETLAPLCLRLLAQLLRNRRRPIWRTHPFFPWNKKTDAVERAKDKADAAFEFIIKLGLPYYCFHDMDVVDYTNDVVENEKRLRP